MKQVKDVLKNRLKKISPPKPSIGIFKGLEPLVFDDGKQEVKKSFYIKLYGKFRDAHLGQLKGSPLSVFLCLALHSNDQGYSWPSISLISKEASYKRDAVFKALKYLESLNFIKRIRRRDLKTQKLKTNLYRIFPRSWRKEEKKT